MKERVKKIRRYDGHRVNSSRICISVPKKLRKLMLKYQEDNPNNLANWSKLSARAFKRFLEKKGVKVNVEEKATNKTTG